MIFIWVIAGLAGCALVFFLIRHLLRLRRKGEVERAQTSPASLLQGESIPDVSPADDGFPRLLHRIWIGKKRFPPYKAVPAIQSFDSVDGEFTQILWKDGFIEKLLDEKYTGYREVYDGYRFIMQKVNLTKYLTMYEYGGIYADLDVVADRPLGEVSSQHPGKCIFFIETVLTEEKARAIGEKNEIRKTGVERGFLGDVPEDQRRIASYLFMAPPRHPLVRDMLEEAKKRSVLPVKYPYDIMYTSGTDLYTTVINHRADRYDDVVILDREEADRYFGHLCFGSWVNFFDFGFRT